MGMKVILRTGWWWENNANCWWWPQRLVGNCGWSKASGRNTNLLWRCRQDQCPASCWPWCWEWCCWCWCRRCCLWSAVPCKPQLLKLSDWANATNCAWQLPAVFWDRGGAHWDMRYAHKRGFLTAPSKWLGMGPLLTSYIFFLVVTAPLHWHSAGGRKSRHVWGRVGTWLWRSPP